MAITALKDVDPASVIEYNGLRFDPLIKSSIQGEPQYDRAGRVVTHIRYTLTVHALIYAQTVSSQNVNMEDVQNRLLAPGATLAIEDIGFGSSITTNARGTKPDMLWGAKPKRLEFQSLGHVAAEVIWTVEFNVSRCASSSALRQVPFMAFNYDATYSSDAEGLTTRTITGYCQVPAIRGEGEDRRALLFDIDAKWDKIACAVPAGFRRMAVTRRINEAKNQLDFAFTDQQLPGDPFPPGVVDASLRFDFENKISAGFIQWMGSLGGSITVAPGVSPSHAGKVYFAILLEHVKRMRANATRDSILPLKMRVSHDLFTRTSSFATTYAVTTCLENILSANGLWAPVAGSDYRRWATSMKDVWHNRGTAKLEFLPDDDQLVDVCMAIDGMSIGNDTEVAKYPHTPYEDQLLFKVTEENSWLQFENVVSGIAEHNAVLHRLAAKHEPGDEIQSNQVSIIQYQGVPDFYAIMHGHAKRLKFKPIAPRLIEIGGVEVQHLNETVSFPDTPVARLFDIPVYKGKWSILYRLPEPPKNVTWSYTTARPTGCGALPAGEPGKENARPDEKAKPKPKNKKNKGMWGPPWFQI